MSALAMSRPFSKTYSRTAQKADHASKAFDEAVLGTTGKPCPVKATSIIQKWGKASFTSTRGSPAAATAPSVTEKSRKRKIADDRNGGTCDDDPFSFDLEDVGPSKAKRGMGFKVPDKAKSGVEPTDETTVEEQRKDVETTNKKVLRDAGRRIEHMANSDFTESGSDGELENGKKMSSSPDAVHVVQKAADVFASQFGGTGDTCRSRNGKGAVKTTTTSQGRQMLMDDFAKKATNLINAKVTTTTNVNSSVSKTMLPSKPSVIQSSKPAVKKFFVSRDRRNNNQPKTSPDALTSTSGSNVESKVTEKSDDVWDSDSVNWDVESGDPEIVFNSAKKVSGVEAVVDKRTVVNKRLVVNKQTVVSKQTVANKQAVVDEQPVVEALRSLSYDVEWDALDSSEEAVSPVKESELKTSLKAKPEAMLHSGATQKSKEKSKEKWKEKTKEVPVVKRLLTGLKKTQSRSKASYNHRQWHNSDEESQPGSGDSQTSVVEVKKTVKDEMAFESSDEEPIKSPAVMYRAVGKPPLGKAPSRCAAEAVAGIKVSKKHKPLFMVVRNVKRAHECQEYGETQEFTDDIDYIMDGLHDGQPVPTRCLSAINLVNKCASHAFRMHLRAHGILAKILSALHDAAKYPTLALCTSAIMYMMSSDRLTLELDGSSLELILQVLSSEVQTTDEDSRTWKEYETIQQKIHSVFDGFHQNGKIQRTDMLSTDITAGNLAMEALLRLTSKRDGDWFKDELRTLGGLDHIIDTVCKAVASLDEAMLELTDSAVDSLTKVDRCFRVLENVTYLKLENQNHLINYSSSALIRTITSCLTFCETCLPFNELTTKGEKVKKDSPGYIIYSCLLASLRVLVNLTHDNEVGSAKVGQEDGLMKTLLTSILRLPRYLPTAERFDVLVLGLGLLVNLVEHSRNNLRVLLSTPTVAPFDQYPSINGEMNSLEALGMLFSLRFEAAKMIEEEHDAELEEKERQRQEMVSRCTMISTSNNQAAEAANKSGVWQESDSGIQWIAAVSKDSRTRDSVSGVSDDASSIGDIQLMGGTSSSQGESENFTKALHKAGRHMEDSIVAAYVALVVGCVIQHNLDLAEKVRDTLPDCSFDPMIRMLRKFLGFMNLTSSSTANSSKSIVRVLEVLESC